jgi:NADH-quinone oxidoreductase subunit L
VLGVLTLVGGVLNVPALVGGGQWLHHWLEPVTAGGAGYLEEVHLEHAIEWRLIGGAVAIALVGIMAAWRLLTPEALVPARMAPAETGLGRVLWKKWYVDELYDAVIVRPVQWLSRVVLWKVVDQGLVDGAGVNGTARLARGLGWVGARLQTGQVGFYVVIFALGVWLVLRAMGT